MPKRTLGRSKLTTEVRERLVAAAREARALVYGEHGCPEWGTLFAEIEDDAKEVGHEFIRLLMEQTASDQVVRMPSEAQVSAGGEPANPAGVEKRELLTESGLVTWDEPKSHLPESRKAFFPSVEGAGVAGR